MLPPTTGARKRPARVAVENQPSFSPRSVWERVELKIAKSPVVQRKRKGLTVSPY